MITEDRGLTMLAGANPVPQLDLIDVDVEASKYLATLEQRSSEVTQLDTKAKDHKEKKKNVMAFLVAAVVVIVAGIGFMVLTQGDEVPTAAPVDNPDDLALEATLATDDLEGFVVCSYSGLTDEVTAGEIGVVFHNQATTGGTGWMDLVRLDEDKTLSDLVNYLESGESDKPDWTTRVYLADFVPYETSTDQVTRTVQPGLHVIVCGTNSPYESQMAGAFTVLP